MKKYILFAAVLTLTMTACSNDDPTQPGQEGQTAARIIAGVDGTKSRANGNVWEADQIGVTVTDAPNSDMATRYANVLYTTSSTTDVADFESTTPIYFQDANETVTFSAYAPYSESLTDNAIAFDVKAQSTRNAQKAIDFIFAEGATASRTNPTVSFSGEHKFTHCMARLVITIKPGKDMTIGDIRRGLYYVGTMYTSGTFNTLTGKVTPTGPNTPESFALSSSIRNNNADHINFTALVIPQEQTSAYEFAAVISGQVYKNTSAIAGKFEAGKSYSYTFTVNKTGIELEASEVDDWDNQANVDGDATM